MSICTIDTLAFVQLTLARSMCPVPTDTEDTLMKKLLAAAILASVASTAFAIPPSHPQPILGEAQSTSTVQKQLSTDRTLSENGFDRTPLSEQIAEDGFDHTPISEQIAEDGFDSTPQAEQFAEDGFDLTPQANQVADDGFDRTPLGQLLAEDGSDRTKLGTA
ncbi:hypothetical protein [Stutzerimonas zhaodongensis]|uniref:hypothetical protein n=1 Tax=Stutzerimonas zhaodongensis TaxID=1176257 RepID=UPI001F4DCAC9|nr:hypothetical protein [Stutzerimonas zhaodongensis]UNG18999.1 hypothetical protein MKP10_01645 [Stutzerimonas zhaodongensis]